MKTYEEDGNLIISLEGRIDSTNAADFERELTEAVSACGGTQPVLDAAELEFISSAGLRVLMRLRKTLGRELTVRNVSKEVYEIFDVTGFTSLLNVERKLRSIEVEGCEVIGRGATATVYRIDPDTIVKVYEIPNALEMIRNEQRRAKQAFVKGIPTAISYDAVRVGDRYGSVFELLDARTMSDALIAAPERVDELVEMHVKLMKTIHGMEADPDELPDCRDIYLGYLTKLGEALPGELRRSLEARFRAMPRDLHMIHGDIYMNNVMLCGDGPLLIDMESLSTGDPVFDLANLFVAYRAFNEDDPTNSRRFIGIDRERCDALMDKTLACYLGTSDGALLSRTMRRVMAVGYVRFLYLVAVMRFGGEELVELRVRHTVARLQELMDGLDDFTMGV